MWLSWRIWSQYFTVCTVQAGKQTSKQWLPSCIAKCCTGENKLNTNIKKNWTNFLQSGFWCQMSSVPPPVCSICLTQAVLLAVCPPPLCVYCPICSLSHHTTRPTMGQVQTHLHYTSYFIKGILKDI